MRISRTWMWQCTCGEKTSSMASQAGFQRSCVYTYSKGEIMDTMTKLCLYTYMLITVNWSGVFHAILQILWQICLLTHHCVGRVANKKRTSHGEFGLGNLHIVKSPRLSRYKLQTLDNYPALEMIRCLEILKLLRWGNLPLVSICNLFLSIFLVRFFFPSNIQPDVLCLVHQMKTGPLKPSRSGHGNVCFFGSWKYKHIDR